MMNSKHSAPSGNNGKTNAYRSAQKKQRFSGIRDEGKRNSGSRAAANFRKGRKTEARQQYPDFSDEYKKQSFPHGKRDISRKGYHSVNNGNPGIQIPEIHFSELLSAMALDQGYLEKRDIPESADFLTGMDYGMECELKLKAMREYWKQCKLPQNMIKGIVPSPKPRNYRTTSKRKVCWKDGGCVFSMGYSVRDAGNGSMKHVLESPLEAEIHGKLYQLIFQILKKEHYEVLVKALNFCIIRGTYEKACVILNIFHINGEVVRKLKMFAEELSKADPCVSSVFMLLDESRSEYYLDDSKSKNTVTVKKLFGREMLDVQTNGYKLLYPPTAFSQVNESMIPIFTETAEKMLNPQKNVRLLDLFCGYGLFSLTMGGKFKSSIGMDMEGPAISAAVDNAKFLFPEKNMRFLASAITQNSVEEMLPADECPEYIILDPPRSGTANGVIQALAERKPEKVIHIFCGVNQIPCEMKIWLSNGYRIRDVKVLDMFPGSPNLETMILLEQVHFQPRELFPSEKF